MAHTGDVGTEIAPEVANRLSELAAFAAATLDAFGAARRSASD
jgi:hypothetical protein